MPTMIVKHTVKDYASWKKGFDAHAEAREVISTGGLILRSAENPDEVTIVMNIKHIGTAKQWAQDPSLKEVMEKAGVMSAPDIRFYEDTATFTV